MILKKFQVHLENIDDISTSKILGSDYGCKKCGINKVELSKSTELKKTKKTKKIKLSLGKKIILVLIMVVLIFALALNNFNLNNVGFGLNNVNDKITDIKVFILTTVKFFHDKLKNIKYKK